MSYQSIITYIDGSPNCGKWSEFAIDLALKHGARLTGIAPRRLATDVIASDYLAVNSSWINEFQQGIDTDIEKNVSAFRALCKEKNLAAHEARIVTGAPADVMKHEAMFCDLMVFGQYLDTADEATSRAGLVESLLLSTAKPILIVPAMGQYSASADNVLIAWRSSRESSVAVQHALPLLADAATVEAVTVETHKGRGRNPVGDYESLADYLALHDVQIEYKIIVSGNDAGNVLLSHACDSGAELLVMGGYGHARLREWALGGVTKTILQTMTLPVLMTH